VSHLERPTITAQTVIYRRGQDDRSAGMNKISWVSLASEDSR
jgi:hypothetical protein